MFSSCFRVNVVVKQIVNVLFLTIVRNMLNVLKITSHVIYELMKQRDVLLTARNRNWVKKNCHELKKLLSEQRRCTEKHNQFLRKNSRRFEKKSLKIFRLDKMRRHLDKREKTFLIQDFDLLDLLNSLNSDQENFIIQRFSILNILSHRNLC